jgi:glycosyltransferase involved in cell wall biosynthesis
VLVLHVGRLAPEKNVELLVAAWTLAREALGARAAFVVAGDGPMASHVEREAPWARRLGFLDRPALASVYACADLCVLPSETETCGLVALEAMASGVPVIAADAGGLRESVRHGRDGLLVPPGDARGFAAAIVELAMEADRRRALGRAARAVAETRDARRELRELIELYRSLVHASAPEAACTAA